MGKKSEKVNKNKSATSVSNCKGCLCHLSSFVFLLSLSCSASHLSGYCHCKVLKQSRPPRHLGIHHPILMPVAVELQVWPDQHHTVQHQKPVTTYLSQEIGTYRPYIWIDKPNKISLICGEVLLNVT